ncbi:MAG: T9SS type A sorting domain-containing protein [Fibrobacter sp.]|nr:T9SS type A sorting domain-containing protein [Fibrobacter sp.]
MLKFRFKASVSLIVPLLGIVLSGMVASAETFTWKNVTIGGGGGFVPNIIYSTAKSGVVYARTDMGGIYRRDTEAKKWIPLTDWVPPEKWNLLGGESVAADPVEPNIVYIAAGTYTNDWTDMNGFILRSKDYGNTFESFELPFKLGGNMPGRGMGERLSIDPNSNNILYLGARSGNGLWKSTNSGESWAKVASFPVTGDYVQDPSLPYTADPVGVVWITFDARFSTKGTPSSKIFVGVAQKKGPTVYVSEDAGETWAALEGQPLGGATDSLHIMPHHGVIRDSVLFIPYSNRCGPYDGNYGEIWKYNIDSKTWTDISPHTHVKDEAWGTSELQKEDCYFGYGGFDVDYNDPNVIVAATLNSWWPDAALYKSVDGGASWTKSFYWTSYPSAEFKYEIQPGFPWLNWGVTTSNWPDVVYPKLGWMISGCVINPFNSNELMYGTGATIYGTENFGDWGDATKKVIFKSVAQGIEECAVLSLAVPPITSGTGSDVRLVSGVGDIGGFAHTDFETPTQMFLTPRFTNTTSIDYAELDPKQVIRVGTASTDLYEKPCNIGSSADGGLSWTKIYINYDTTYASGQVAMSSKGSTILWAPSGKVPVYGSLYGLKDTKLPADAWVASDRVNDSLFYAFKDSIFYAGMGESFSKSDKLPIYSSKIKAVPGFSEHVWLPATTSGLWYTEDAGKTFKQIDTTLVQAADVIGYGKAAPGASYPAIYITGKVSGKTGIFMSKDKGESWIRINDDAHQYGSINYSITGDMRQYGIVFVATNGRGIVYGVSDGSSVNRSNLSSHPKLPLIKNTGSFVTAQGVSPLKLFDLNGKVMRSSISNGKMAQINLKGLSRGIYIARSGTNVLTVIVR